MNDQRSGTVGAIAAVLALPLAVYVGFAVPMHWWPLNDDPSVPSAGAPAIPVDAQTEIVSPANNSTVKSMFTVSGTAGEIGDSTLWMFVWGPSVDSAGKNVYFRQSTRPLAVADGHWSISIGPLGEDDPSGKAYTLRLVKAEPACSAKIESLDPTPNGEYYLNELPTGCKVVDPTLVVHKS